MKAQLITSDVYGFSSLVVEVRFTLLGLRFYVERWTDSGKVYWYGQRRDGSRFYKLFVEHKEYYDLLVKDEHAEDWHLVAKLPTHESAFNEQRRLLLVNPTRLFWISEPKR